ncbi:DNA repair protein RecO [Facklamia sp. DSM 111018]|uniref:DNA repair protein RecO n=1 Tax=Facklamia lactis TaxID=2749967 RepID=A0ABS0LP12_9LACT|nr:DNA repair protein RecO [Facklamia lactis]MBG9980099.1 DNA repair protein RecO [Facklamia lactis]MBG9985901.1 DNA repair protein RecO [Facklamia lactis]
MLESFEGIVLFMRPHREKDALVKIFTQTHGTKMFFVKGLQALNHPLKQHCIPMSQHEYIGTIHSTGLSFIREAQTLDIHRKIQMDPILQAHAAYLCQLVDASIEDNQPDSILYQFLAKGLQMINRSDEARPFQIAAEVQLLHRFGLAIDWDRCVFCHNHEGPMDFSMQQQGILCERHFNEDPFRLQLRPQAIAVVKLLSKTAFEQIGNIKLSEPTYQDIRRLMHEIYRDMVGIHLKSETYLEEIYKFMRITNDFPFRES